MSYHKISPARHSSLIDFWVTFVFVGGIVISFIIDPDPRNPLVICILYFLFISIAHSHILDFAFLNATIWKGERIFEYANGKTSGKNSEQIVTKNVVKHIHQDIAKLVYDYCAPPKIFDARLDKFDEWFTRSHMQMEVWKNDDINHFNRPRYILKPMFRDKKFTFIVPGRLDKPSRCVVKFGEMDPRHETLVHHNMGFLANLPYHIGLKNNLKSDVMFKKRDRQVVIECRGSKQDYNAKEETKFNTQCEIKQETKPNTQLLVVAPYISVDRMGFARVVFVCDKSPA